MQRSKWTESAVPFQVGTMVFSLKSTLVFIGCITSVSPGFDGIVRVVTVET